ncbi:sulfotransferase family protein [Novosphingobium sp. M1R2S20]|uniref:Sulfotransferase n=1 Tax=Novosphingobium rhizovicinum TaxID=3228928 RepID=A0ABV3RED9_9SPHN
MTVDDIISAAQARTGLTDIGDRSVLEGLEKLLHAYETEAKFTEQGRQMAYNDLVTCMSSRMQIEDWLARHPELLSRPVEKPMFVFGLPRTGTTLMINLLASDPARRSFLRWEIYEPIPPARPEELHAGRRYEERQAICEMALEHVPQIAAIHMEFADSPTECQFLMTPSFCSQVYEALAEIPSYRQWFLHEADYLPAFRFHKRTLQALQHYTGGRWTLKNPWHPLFLDPLTEVYPDAQLVMTHRDPAEVVGSCCSLLKYSRQVYSDDIDLQAIGRDLLDTFRIMVDRQRAFREKHGRNAIHDVQYVDTVRDPIGTVRKIYEAFDEELTPAALDAMNTYMAENPKGKHGKHEYSLADYGLSTGQVREAFSDYIEEFDILIKEH